MSKLTYHLVSHPTAGVCSAATLSANGTGPAGRGEFGGEGAPEAAVVDRQAAWVGDLTAQARAYVGRTAQASADLQRGDAGLEVGQAPDAAYGVEQADEVQAGNAGVHHVQVAARRAGRVAALRGHR